MFSRDAAQTNMDPHSMYTIPVTNIAGIAQEICGIWERK